MKRVEVALDKKALEEENLRIYEEIFGHSIEQEIFQNQANYQGELETRTKI